MKIKYLTLFSCLMLAACETGGSHHLNQSLQQYVGQTAAQVRSQLDLNKMGFKTTQEPTQTAELLSYTIVRDMNIPIGTPMPTPSNGGYNIKMECQVGFNLKDEIVQSIHYTGRAC